MRKQYINDYKDMLKLEVEAAVDYMKYKMAQTEERLKESIKARVYEAYAIARNLYINNSGRVTDDRLRELVKAALRPIRFNSGRGYYFELRCRYLRLEMVCGLSIRSTHISTCNAIRHGRKFKAL